MGCRFAVVLLFAWSGAQAWAAPPPPPSDPEVLGPDGKALPPHGTSPPAQDPNALVATPPQSTSDDDPGPVHPNPELLPASPRCQMLIFGDVWSRLQKLSQMLAFRDEWLRSQGQSSGLGLRGPYATSFRFCLSAQGRYLAMSLSQSSNDAAFDRLVTSAFQQVMRPRCPGVYEVLVHWSGTRWTVGPPPRRKSP